MYCVIYFTEQVRGFHCGLKGEFILLVYVGMQFVPCPFFMRLFMPLGFLAKILVIRNLIPLTRLVLCAQPWPMSPVGAAGYGISIPSIWCE